jgi:hypothetical protein
MNSREKNQHSSKMNKFQLRRASTVSKPLKIEPSDLEIQKKEMKLLAKQAFIQRKEAGLGSRDSGKSATIRKAAALRLKYQS